MLSEVLISSHSCPHFLAYFLTGNSENSYNLFQGQSSALGKQYLNEIAQVSDWVICCNCHV